MIDEWTRRISLWTSNTSSRRFLGDESRRFVWKGMPPSAAGLETGFRIFSVTIRITGAIAHSNYPQRKSRFCSNKSFSQRGVLPSFAHFQKADLID